MKIRPSTVAGMFYPADPVQLNRVLDRFFSQVSPAGGALGIVSPHAGYIYSGQTAAHAFAEIDREFNGTFLIIGPSHRGFPSCTSLITWGTPLGEVRVNSELVSLIDLPVDDEAMVYGNENSIEVQVPFIQFRFPECPIAPIMMGHQTMDEIIRLADIIGSALDKYSGDVRIVASSDFSHYVSHEKAKHDDLYAIEPITHMDVKEFYSRIQKHRITACGYGPISVMVEILKKRGGTRCDLVSYTTSAEASGDYHQVVGYAALAVK